MGQSRIRLTACAVVVGAVALPGGATALTRSRAGTGADQTPVGTVSVASACYVNTSRSAAQITISGAGWQAGDTITLSDTLEQISATATISPNGTFTDTVSAPVVDSSTSPEISDKIGAYDEANPSVTTDPDSVTAYSASFMVTNYAVTDSGDPRDPLRRTSFELSGFTPGRTVYGHYLNASGTLLSTVAFGTPTGPCGLRRVDADPYPGGHPKPGRYTIQFDDSRRYRERTAPHFDFVLHLT